MACANRSSEFKKEAPIPFKSTSKCCPAGRCSSSSSVGVSVALLALQLWSPAEQVFVCGLSSSRRMSKEELAVRDVSKFTEGQTVS